MNEVKEKNIVVCIILSLVTCGIYGIVWFINLTDDMKKASGDQSLSGGKAFLLTLITCGIYGFFWIYKMGKASYSAKINRGMQATDNSILYLILQIFGLGIVNYCLIQNDLNDIAGTVQSMNQPAQSMEQQIQSMNQPAQSMEQQIQSMNQPVQSTEQQIQSMNQPAPNVQQSNQNSGV